MIDIPIFQGRNCNHLYLKTLKYILQNGHSTSPRGIKTKEIHPALTIIEKPQERFLSCYGRNINPFFLIAEALWILAGRGDVEWITHYNSQLNKFDDGYPDFHGAYGVRLRKYGKYKDYMSHMLWRNKGEIDQIKEIVNKLKKDKQTRQAVMCLWNPFFDNEEGSKDYPCNNLSYFKIRNNKLHLHQILRSNDVNLGLYPTNVFQWSIIQEYVASALGVELGHLLFFSDSLHCYKDAETKKLITHVLKGKGGRGVGDISPPNNNIYDIYNYIHPILLQHIPLQRLDKYVEKIVQNELKYREGNWDVTLATDIPLLQSMELMLKVYNMRLHREIYGSIEEISYIPCNDFKILAYQYAYNKTVDTDIKDWILHYKFNRYIKHFIMNGGVNNG